MFAICLPYICHTLFKVLKCIVSIEFGCYKSNRDGASTCSVTNGHDTPLAEMVDVVSENIEDDVRALMKVYDVQFKVLQNNVDHVDWNLCNLRQTWEEMRPDQWVHPDVMTEHLEEEEQIEMFEGENVGC